MLADVDDRNNEAGTHKQSIGHLMRNGIF